MPRSSFRSGFMLWMIITRVLLMIYQHQTFIRLVRLEQ